MTDRQETDRVQVFLDLYKQLEEALEAKYRGNKRRTYSVVLEFTRDEESRPVREKLDVCREIRNLLTHSSNLEGQPVAVPSAGVVRALEEILAFVRRPPLALEYARRGDQIMKAGLNHKVLSLMAVMDKNGYSHIPVLQNGVFCGVFSSGAVFRYLLRSGGRAISPQMTLRDLGEYLEVGQHVENYEFVAKSTTYAAVRNIFEKVRGKNKRVSVVFITADGRPGQRLLGMLTPWDVLGE